MTFAAYSVFALAAVVDWVAVARDDRRIEKIAKPAALAALVVAAVTLDPAVGAADRRVWFTVALVFSLVGDVALMLDSDRFVVGLGAFLVAHVAYIVGFWIDPPAAGAVLVALGVTAVVMAPLALRIVGAVGASEPGLRTPVAVYITVISAMVVSASASGNGLAALGAVTFAASDTLIAWNRFVRPFRASGVAIMVTYHLAQLALVVSLVR
ncbi:MAG: lysoplasmalogenase [Actinomycetota bacterium]